MYINSISGAIFQREALPCWAQWKWYFRLRDFRSYRWSHRTFSSTDLSLVACRAR
jgi:hypothetical protein